MVLIKLLEHRLDLLKHLVAAHILLHINMKPNNIAKLLESVNECPSKWELDNVIWADRGTNPTILKKFLERIQTLSESNDTLTTSEASELERLTELLDDMDIDECSELLNLNEDASKESFIENLARTSAIEVLTNEKLSFETMTTACKLSPNDFILCAKRTQDLINAIHGLVIKGETLSNDVAGA